MDGDALVVGVSSFVAAAVYLYLGVRLGRRPVSEAMWLPAAQFALFWIGLAISSVLGGVLSVDAAFYSPPLGVVVAFQNYDAVVDIAALWGLTSYLFYLYSGRSVLVPISLLYVVEYALVVYYFAAGQPDGVTIAAGSVNPHYAMPVTGLFEILPVVLLVIPEFIAAIAYFTLFFRTRDRTVRYRVTVVSWGLVAWFLLDFLSGSSLFTGSLVALALSRVLLVVVTLVILSAYYPPKFVQSRLGIAAI